MPIMTVKKKYRYEQKDNLKVMSDESGNLIELWNIQNGVPVYTGAQEIFNILGRLRDTEPVKRLVYKLNGGPDVPVFFKNGINSAARLARDGDFNIDTINRTELLPVNRLQMTAHLKDGNKVTELFELVLDDSMKETGPFNLDFNNVRHAQQLGQLIDGKWRVNRDEKEQAFLEIRPEDAGLDRIILFGRDELSTDYTIRARLQVRQWLSPVHNVGLLFKWNPHLQSNGTSLPSQWTTGLGYYYSDCPGLRIRIGVNVRLDKNGIKVGDNILGENMFSSWRYWTNRIVRKITRGKYLVPQITPGLHYWFELAVSDNAYKLTVWPVEQARPVPQVSVKHPPELLSKGAVGIIAHYCAVRIFEFQFEPHCKSESGK